MKIATIGRGKIGGGLANAAAQEAMIGLAFGIAKEGGMGQFFYRFAPAARF